MRVSLLLLLFVCSSAPALAADACRLRLGMILPLTGNAAQFGERTRDAALLAAEDANSFMPGCPLELHFEDSAWDTAKGVRAFQALSQLKQIDAVVTGASHISLAVAPLTASRGMMQIAIFSSAEKFSSPGDLTFRISPRAGDEIRPLLEFAAESGRKRAGALFIANEFGEGMRDALRAGGAAAGLVTVFEEQFLPADSDFRSSLLKAKSAGVDVLLVVGLPSHYVPLVRQARELAFDPMFLSPRSAADPSVAELERYTDKFFLSDPYDAEADSDLVREFNERYRARFGAVPDTYCAEGYESVRVLGRAWAECRGESRCIAARLSDRSIDTVFGTLRFDGNGDAEFPTVVKRFSGGIARAVPRAAHDH